MKFGGKKIKRRSQLLEDLNEKKEVKIASAKALGLELLAWGLKENQCRWSLQQGEEA